MGGWGQSRRAGLHANVTVTVAAGVDNGAGLDLAPRAVGDGAPIAR